MKETTEGFVPQEQHDAAMLALRAELSEAIDLKQSEIISLTQQVVNANAIARAEVAEQIATLTAERDAEKSRADAMAADNTALRDSLASYLLKTDGGQAAMREFRKMILTSNIQASQAELAGLQDRSMAGDVTVQSVAS